MSLERSNKLRYTIKRQDLIVNRKNEANIEARMNSTLKQTLENSPSIPYESPKYKSKKRQTQIFGQNAISFPSFTPLDPTVGRLNPADTIECLPIKVRSGISADYIVG